MVVLLDTELRLVGAVFARARIEDGYRKPVFSGQEEGGLQIRDVGRADVLVQLAQIDRAVSLIFRSIVVGDLDEKDQLSVGSPGCEVATIEFDFDPSLKALVESESGARDVDGPVEGAL